MRNFVLIFAIIISVSTFGSLRNIEGLDHRGKELNFSFSEKSGTILVFLSAKCPCSDSHIEEIKRLKSKYASFNFIGIHSNYTETKEEAVDYFTSKKVNFPIIHDRDSKIAKKLGALKTPHAYILDKNGEIVYMGGVTNRSNALKASKFYLDDTLSEIKSGKVPEVKERKTLGCYIALKE